MTKVYFAAPLFCEGEKTVNKKICDLLESFGYEVFLPQRDGILAAELENKTEKQKIELVFAKDTAAIKKSDALIFMLDGRVPDEGACVELGIAYAMGKRCYGISTDARALEDGLKINPLIAGCFKKMFFDSDFQRLMSQLSDYLSKNSL